MITFSLLTTALLFGGMTLYAFGFAAFIFIALTVETASFLIRKAFLHLRLGHSHCSGPYCIFQQRHSSLDPIFIAI